MREKYCNGDYFWSGIGLFLFKTGLVSFSAVPHLKLIPEDQSDWDRIADAELSQKTVQLVKTLGWKFLNKC